MENPKKRRHCLPVLYVRGTHYEVGYNVGRTFRYLIQNFMNTNKRFKEFLREYNTINGKNVYEATFQLMQRKFPYYINEMRGIADGSEVPFHNLFLLQMDDIIETVNTPNVTSSTCGCSTVGINENNVILGHTEDAFAETLNHIYIVQAHIIPSAEDAIKGAKEERFTSLCYAGHLPGYTMGYNGNGLIFTINTLSPAKLAHGKTPRTFITRALLTARTLKEAEEIIRDKGTGTANGFSVNLTFIGDAKVLFNFEVAPNFEKVDESLVNVNPYPDNKDYLIHVNKYCRLFVPEVGGLIIDSSNVRTTTLKHYEQPKTKKDVMDMLSDVSDSKFRVFQDIDDAEVKTVAAGVFDVNERTWSIYTDRPSFSEPIAIIPLFVIEN